MQKGKMERVTSNPIEQHTELQESVKMQLIYT